MPKRSKPPTPDEAYQHGPISIARYGKHMHWQFNADPESHAQFQKEVAAKLPEIEGEIDELVERIVNRVSGVKPTELMKRAWWELAAKSLFIDVEADVTSEDGHAMRMVDYVQSIIASFPPAEEQSDDASEEVWGELNELIESLFQKINVEHAIAVSVVSKLSNPNHSDLEEEFKFKSKYYWINVRGQRYYAHQIQALHEMLAPHTDQIQLMWGISADNLITELEKVWRSLTFGMGDAFQRMEEVRTSSLDLAVKQLRDQAGVNEETFDETVRSVLASSDLGSQAGDAIGKLFGLDLFDLKKTTTLPDQVLEALSWAPGESTTFFEAGPHRGWPLRVWPTFQRPFLKCDGSFFCFDLHSLFDHIYRQVERCAFDHSKELKTAWIDQRKRLSEDLPATHLAKLLPAAVDHGEVYYRWKTGRAGKRNWCEADRLITFGDTLFVIEVKAGAFTRTSPALDFEAYIASIKNLVGAPSKQADRFLEYFRSEDEIALFDRDHNEVSRLRHADFKRVFKLAVTLDPFTEMAAQVQHFGEMDVDLGAEPVWPVSIDDLRVFSDVFSNAIEFIHFLEQRFEAYGSQRLKLDDELDHLGLYLEHNHYRQHAEQMCPQPNAEIQFVGYRSVIDRYYNSKLVDETDPSPLTQNMPYRLREVIDYLSRSSIPDRVEIGCYLLDVDGEWRSTIFNTIERELLSGARGGSLRPLSSFGNVRLSVYPGIQSTVGITADAERHAKSQIITQAEPDRMVVALDYDTDLKLTNVAFRKISAEDISTSELPELRRLGEQIRIRRVGKVSSQRKIGRNELCPCGSGKKYKKCCLGRQAI